MGKSGHCFANFYFGDFDFVFVTKSINEMEVWVTLSLGWFGGLGGWYSGMAFLIHNTNLSWSCAPFKSPTNGNNSTRNEMSDTFLFPRSRFLYSFISWIMQF